MRRIAIFVLILLAPKVFACSCVFGGDVSLAKAAMAYPLVFTGVVESIDDTDVKRVRSLAREEQSAAFSRGELQRHVTFRTMQIWKSDIASSEHFVLDTGEGGGDCGYPFQQGKAYLVFAYRGRDGRASTGICSSTIALVCATDRIEELGAPFKTYETADRTELIAREQPYNVYWMSCIKPAVLITDRNLTMDKHCWYEVDAIIDREGNLSTFDVKRTSVPNCPSIVDAVKSWKFEAATIDGVPVAVRMNAVSLLEPITKSEYEKQLAEQKKWLDEHPPKKQ